jgi:DNA helicase II / ATP-dependent DNA helicase PcrA
MSLYDKIMKYTDDQQTAINCIGENLQIIACAGSGKTQVISQRIINILKNDPNPSRVIAFTYTDKAAGELKSRILKLCREQLPDIKGLSEMYVGTIHSWCLNVLRDYKYEFQKFSVLDEIKLKLFLDRNFSNSGMTFLNMEKFKDTGHFVQLMGLLREAKFCTDAIIPDEIIQAKVAYVTLLEKFNFLDFTAIMTKALHYLKNDEPFRFRVKSKIGYLIVDEYQDVNTIQEQIIHTLYELGANTCVVGDDDQTIFQWRGSKIGYIQKFKDNYYGVRSVILDDNFRSSNAIVDVALKCISNNINRLPKSMVAKCFQKYERGDILYNQYDSIDSENQFIIDTIRSLRGVKFQDKEDSSFRGLDYSDFVILIRKWKKADSISAALLAAEIPFIVTGVNNLFIRPEIQAARAIYLFLDNQIDESTIKSHWSDLSPSLHEIDIDSAINYLVKSKPHEKTYYEAFILQKIFHDFLDKAGIREDKFINQDVNGTPDLSAEEVIFYNLGMFSQIINDFEVINFKSPPRSKLKNFINFLIHSAADYYPEGWLNNSYKSPNAVQIMTIYQAKGLEFPVVFIPGLNKNYLPTKQPSGKQVWHFIDKKLIEDHADYFPHEEDERRLLYVAITRSKKFLYISRAHESNLYGKESVFGPEIRQSTFVFTAKDRDFSEREKITPKSSSEISNISLNFSILKSFFDCPYSFKFYSFYGFQNPLGARIGYGSAIHNALMELHREYLEGNLISKEDLSSLVEHHKNFPYATDALDQALTQRAKEAVNIYYDRNIIDFKDIVFAEKEIQIDLGDGIIVSGKMDLIKKRNHDGTIEKIIIDFKSTEDAQAYNASMDQLQLYALGYKELTGENADFLQIYNLDTNDPNTTELKNDDLDKMKVKIIDAANDIRSNHLNSTCDDPKCVCRFKNSK